jgi:ubiquinone/menaquinone biosynthesis C-methylase UbiE
MPLAQSGVRVLALDVSASMLARFPPSAADLPIARVLGSAQSLPLTTASVDIITCGFGIAFFPDLAGALAEMRRVLRPPGQLALSWWRFDVATPWVEAQRIRSTLDAEAARRQRSLDEVADSDEVTRRVWGAGFESPQVRHFTLEWTEESVAAFRDARAFLWEREHGAPVPTAALDQLEAVAAGWTSPDGRVRYPLRAFAVLARGRGDRTGRTGPSA